MIKPKKYPRICTVSAKAYYLSDIELINFLSWVGYMAGSLDYMRDVAAKALKDVGEKVEEAKSKGMIDELRHNRLILIQMLHTRMTENYLAYLTSILREAFCCRPEILRSSEKVEIVEVLAFKTIDDLVAHLADKKVYDLSYKSVVDLDDFFQERLGTRLVPAEQRADLVKAVETRNIIVHNRGIRNKHYCSRVGEDPDMVGKIRDIGIKYSEKVNLMFFNSVKTVDSTLRNKLKIKSLRVDIYKEFKNREA